MGTACLFNAGNAAVVKCHICPAHTDYDKKKYVWKLLYVYMLGYPVEFGHKQASDLIAAGK